MGTRINVTIEHHVRNYRDHAAMVELLAPTVPAAMAVADYWRTVDPNDADAHPDAWTPFLVPQYPIYRGPGSLFLRFGPKLAVVFTGGRWRGFLSIEPLRRVHLAAFHSIARVLGANRLVYFPSEGVADDITLGDLDEGISQEECMAKLRRFYGPPQPSVEKIASEIVAETEHCVPSVWYVETLRHSA